MDDERALTYENYNSGGSKKRTSSDFDSQSYKRQNTNSGHNVDSVKTIDTLYRILCPVKKIGSVLGKGGQIINALREETHAKIRVSETIPGADERTVIVYSYAQQEAENDENQNNASDNPSQSDNQDMKPHCPAQDALLKIHDRIVADEYMRGGVVHESAEPLDDVTARILVPDNQVGCLLGKSGSIVKKLRQETSANIRILGSEHLPPCAMRTDELVQISGKQIIVRRALYEISTLLHHHPRKENLRLEDIISASKQQLYQSGPAIPPFPHGNPVLSRYAPPTSWFDGYKSESFSHDPRSFSRTAARNEGVLEDFSIKVLCAAEKIGSIIGKSGSNVRQLERQTGASIHIEDTNPDDKERVIIVSSKEAPSNPFSPTIEAVLQLQKRTSEVSEKGTITTRLLVSSNKVGCLLGQGGSVISEMRRRTRADIQVFSKSEKPKYASADEELVQVSGDENVAETALSEIVCRLRARSLQGVATSDPVPDGLRHGVFSSESFSRRGRRSSGAMGANDPVLHDYPMGYDYPKDPIYSRGYDHSKNYDYPKAYEYPKGYDYPNYDYPKSYDYSKGYDYTKSYDYPKGYDYPMGSDYTKSYDNPKDAGQQYSTQGYPGSLRFSGYSDIRSPEDVRTPKSSVLGMGGSNVSDANQVAPSASWRYLDHPNR